MLEQVSNPTRHPVRMLEPPPSLTWSSKRENALASTDRTASTLPRMLAGEILPDRTAPAPWENADQPAGAGARACSGRHRRQRAGGGPGAAGEALDAHGPLHAGLHRRCIRQRGFRLLTMIRRPTGIEPAKPVDLRLWSPSSLLVPPNRSGVGTAPPQLTLLQSLRHCGPPKREEGWTATSTGAPLQRRGRASRTSLPRSRGVRTASPPSPAPVSAAGRQRFTVAQSVAPSETAGPAVLPHMFQSKR
jgi:hypothetical protein